jgi:16S rRNA G1207 methylase RsmC
VSHYFESPTGPEHRQRIRARIWGRDYTFTTANGVFSGSRLDLGTAVLLRGVDPPVGPMRLLDLGCGFGPIAVALATECPDALVDAVDVNDRALELTRVNAAAAGVGARVRVGHPEAFEDGRYDQIWSNPPIRIGKPALHELLAMWLARLAPGGRAVLVVQRNLGADSLLAWLAGQGWSAVRVASAKGFRVIRVSSQMPC